MEKAFLLAESVPGRGLQKRLFYPPDHCFGWQGWEERLHEKFSPCWKHRL